MSDDDQNLQDDPDDQDFQDDTTAGGDDDQPSFNEENDDEKHEAAKTESVLGEEDPFSGDATSSESPDIDEELAKVGLHGGNRPLGLDDELEKEEF